MRKVAKKVCKLSLFSQLSAPIKSGVRAPTVDKHSSTQVDEGRKKSCNLLAIKMQVTNRVGEGGEEPAIKCEPGSELRLFIIGRR